MTDPAYNMLTYFLWEQAGTPHQGHKPSYTTTTSSLRLLPPPTTTSSVNSVEIENYGPLLSLTSCRLRGVRERERKGGRGAGQSWDKIKRQIKKWQYVTLIHFKALRNGNWKHGVEAAVSMGGIEWLVNLSRQFKGSICYLDYLKGFSCSPPTHIHHPHIHHPWFKVSWRTLCESLVQRY